MRGKENAGGRGQHEERDKGWLREGKPGETWESSLDGIDSDNTPGWKISDASPLEEKTEDEKVSLTPFFPCPLMALYPQGANTPFGGRPFGETWRFSLRRYYLVSFFSIPREKCKGKEDTRGSPIIIPFNAFLLAHPSQMGAAINIRKTAVFSGISFDALYGMAKKLRFFEDCSPYVNFRNAP